jgi:hypothetical protein
MYIQVFIYTEVRSTSREMNSWMLMLKRVNKKQKYKKIRHNGKQNR